MDEKQELLEIYKLHAELADSVSRQRGTTNRFYMLVLSGLLVFLWGGSLFGVGLDPTLFRIGFIVFGGLGVLLTVAWYNTIRSFRQLNSGKFRALDELEEKLAYPFFKREWELLKKGTERRSYRRLIVVETFVPIIFFYCFLVLIAIGIYALM